VQQRSVWRAVLPHAIANRLAKMALQNIPLDTLKATLIDGKSGRLLRSFSRRLGYLHDNKVASRIVSQWLAEGGFLANIGSLSAIEMAIFENIAPVDPEAVLRALERVLPESLSRRDSLARIIRLIAYDPKFFDRCIELLLRCGASAGEIKTSADHDRHLTSLFYIILSGTNAPIEQRLKILDSLLRSDDAHRRKAGIKALHNVLEVAHFGSGADFEFGARPRDYGLWPKTGAEVKHWYVSALRLVQSISLSTLPIAPAVRIALASGFRGLWNQPLLQSELDRLCRSIAKAGFWREGWTSVRQTLKYDSNGMTKEAKAKLIRLEKFLKPKDSVQKVRGIVLSANSPGLDFDDLEIDHDNGGSNALDRLNSIAIELGNDVAHETAAFQELLPELTSVYGVALWSFGKGLAASADDPKAMWTSIVRQFASTPTANRNTQLLCGFLEGLSKRDMELANNFLDQAVTLEGLAAWFPELQCAIAIDGRGVKRLQQSLKLNVVAMFRYRYLAMGRVADPITGPNLKELLVMMASKPDGGLDSAIEILYMRFFSDEQQQKPVDPALIEAGRELIAMLDLTKVHRQRDHRIGLIIKLCLTDADGAKGVEALCRKLKNAIAAREIYAFSLHDLLENLFKAHPRVALDELLGGDDADRKLGYEIITDVSHHHANPLVFVPLDELLAWCERKPSERYPLLARVLPMFDGKRDQSSPLAWSAAALAILDKAPDRVAALRQFVFRFRPRSWSGSRAAVLEARLPLLLQLETHADPDVVTFAKADGARLRKEVDRERERETKDDQAHDERFE
jgi:hypothetical protein